MTESKRPRRGARVSGGTSRRRSEEPNPPRVLVVEIGGNNVKLWVEGVEAARKVPSGPGLTPEAMVEGVLAAAGDWGFDVVTVGVPRPARGGRPGAKPPNRGPGWVGCDCEAAFATGQTDVRQYPLMHARPGGPSEGAPRHGPAPRRGAG